MLRLEPGSMDMTHGFAFIEDRYYVTWCNGYHGPTIGVAYTYDFCYFFTSLENAFYSFQSEWSLVPS